MFGWVLFSLTMSMTICLLLTCTLYLSQHWSSAHEHSWFFRHLRYSLQSFHYFQTMEVVDRPILKTLIIFWCGSTMNGMCICRWDWHIKHSFQSFLHKTQHQHLLFFMKNDHLKFMLVWFLSSVSFWYLEGFLGLSFWDSKVVLQVLVIRSHFYCPILTAQKIFEG